LGVADMALTEEQLVTAKAELARRAKAESDRYHAEYVQRQKEAEERHFVKMEAAYPGISRETFMDIYIDMLEFFEGN
jgi:hypothetical protein